MITFIVMLGVGGKHLRISEYPTQPLPSAQTVISFMTFVASSVLSWCTMTPDYGVYHDVNASRCGCPLSLLLLPTKYMSMVSYRIFIYAYFGLLLSNVSRKFEHFLMGCFDPCMIPYVDINTGPCTNTRCSICCYVSGNSFMEQGF